MKHGVTISTHIDAAEPRFLVEVSRAAEEFGFESVWMAEPNPCMPDHPTTDYPYSEDGSYLDVARCPFPDPLIAAGVAAAVTESVLIGTGVLLLPLRPPAVVAKSLATIDHLSGGRLLVGVGSGWLEEMYVATGLPFHSRGRLLEECVESIRALWSEDSASYQGEHVRFHGQVLTLRPTQPGGIPFIFGGHSDAAARRAGRLGDGFYPHVTDLVRLGVLLDVMRASAEDAGRDPDTIEVTAPWPREPEEREAMEALGVARAMTILRSAHREPEGVIEDLAALAEGLGR